MRKSQVVHKLAHHNTEHPSTKLLIQIAATTLPSTCKCGVVCSDEQCKVQARLLLKVSNIPLTSSYECGTGMHRNHAAVSTDIREKSMQLRLTHVQTVIVVPALAAADPRP